MEGLDFSMDYSRRAAESLTRRGNIMAFTIHCVTQDIVGNRYLYLVRPYRRKTGGPESGSDSAIVSCGGSVKKVWMMKSYCEKYCPNTTNKICQFLQSFTVL